MSGLSFHGDPDLKARVVAAADDAWSAQWRWTAERTIHHLNGRLRAALDGEAGT